MSHDAIATKQNSEFLSIVLCDLDEDSNRLFCTILNQMNNVEVFSEKENYINAYDLIQKINPSIIILNTYPSEETAFRFAKTITEKSPGSALFLTSPKSDPSIVIRSLRVGAKEFILQPVNKKDLLLAIDKIKKTKLNSEDVPASEGEISTFFGVKGGVGTTTIIANIAESMAKYLEKDKSTVVVDLNLQHGNLDLMLDIKSKYSIIDIAKNIDNIDPKLIKSSLPISANGVYLLAAPSKIEESEKMTAHDLQKVLLILKKVFEYILIDTHHIVNDMTLEAIDQSNKMFLISFLDVPSIYNTKKFLNLLNKLGYSKEKIFLIINRHSLFDEVDLKAMEKLIDYPIYWRIPNEDIRSVIQSINKGIPITIKNPNSKLSKNLIGFSQNLTGEFNLEINRNFRKKILKRK